MEKQKRQNAGPRVLRGSLITLKRKCGKPQCRCVQGEPHQTPALSYSQRGVTRMVTLRPEDIHLVKAALERYRLALAALEREAVDGITGLRELIKTGKAR